ncbi:MAG: hypothetical protein K9N52_01935 [Verrucomicrobia bacterium]|nr:hypothetical protein [Verrucomicrobiota bacterium]
MHPENVKELELILKQLQVGAMGLQGPRARKVRQQSGDVMTISIPTHVRDWPLDQMPLSVRLSGVLQKMGFKKLGDLHGLSYIQVLSMRNCGRRSIFELVELVRRLQAGEFDPVKVKGSGIDYLTEFLDDIIDELGERERQMLMLRMGADGGPPMTLEEVGSKYGLTRERVRQVVDLLVLKILRSGGPPIQDLLEDLAEQCLSAICPLTPELFVKWLGITPAKHCRYAVPFYIRLFSALEPSLPGWSEGQKPSPNPEMWIKEISRPLTEILKGSVSPLSFENAYKKLKSNANLSKLTPGEFLAALKQSRTLAVEFPEPEKPVIRLSSLRIHDWVQRVLLNSEDPMTPQEIIKSAKELFSENFPDISIGGLRNSLKPEHGIFLLDRRAFGTRKHIKLPERLWRRARNDVAKLLQKEERPVSTREIIRDNTFGWACLTNVYELAQVLRDDTRFTDLGRFLFALESWGMGEREHIKDLIPKILKEKGQPMTANQILDELKARRSVGRATISAVIRNHPDIKRLGYGYYGLKEWKEMPKEFIVNQPSLISKKVISLKPPVSFAEVCKELDIPVKGKLADDLWNTLQVSSRIKTKDEEKSASALIVQRNARVAEKKKSAGAKAKKKKKKVRKKKTA